MNIKNLFQQITQGSTSFQFAVATVLLLWLVVLVMIIGGVILMMTPPKPTQPILVEVETPTIILEPSSATVGTPISVHGQAWTSAQSVLIFLVSPGQSETANLAIANATVDSSGQFSTGFVVPAIGSWSTGGTAMVVARGADSPTTVQAAFNVIAAPPVTATPTTVSPTPVIIDISTATATSTPAPGQPLLVANTDVNIRSGPGITYQILGLLRADQSAAITGRSFDDQWWQIRFAGATGDYGWVSSRYVAAQNTGNVPVVQAPPLPPTATPTSTSSPTATPTASPTRTPTATPTPVMIIDWRGEYYPNLSLSGAPIVRNDVAINFDWGWGSPITNIPADNFSVRWTRNSHFKSGAYLFRAWVDDGVRLFIDDNLVLDSWHDGSPRLVEAQRQLNEGSHRVRIEYYERSGGASIKTEWQRQEAPSNQLPLAAPGGPYTVNEGNWLTLDGRASKDPDGRIVNYEWDLNYNGNSFTPDVSGATVNTTYPDGPANIRVALRVTDDRGAVHVALASVIVYNVAPVVEAGGPYAGQVGQPITLIGTAGDAGSIDQAGLFYEWDLGDGTAVNGPVVSHSYPQPGTYTVKLTVRDRDAAQSSDTATVQVIAISQPPQAVISGPSDSKVGEVLTFNGAGSGDNDGTIVSYNWNFGDGTTDKGVSVTKSFNDVGSYSVTLTVVDNDGLQSQATHLVQIDNVIEINLPPIVILQAPVRAGANQIVEFDGSQSFDPEGTLLTLEWDFGDGATGQGEFSLHLYEQPGEYTVTLTATDETGLSDTATHLLSITEPADDEIY